MTNLKTVSKLLSLILRHESERFGVTLDAEGYTLLEDVLRAVRTSLPETRLEDILDVVRTVEPAKQRFSVVGDEIRANYGHTLALRIQHEVATPPPELFHGTHQGVVEAVLVSGLRPMARQYVHLTPNRTLARAVGGRRGRPVILRVDTTAAAAAGVVFYRANPSFWLADCVPAAFLSLAD